MWTTVLTLLAVLAATICLHWRRHAIGSSKPSEGVARAPGCLPVLGDGLTVLRNQPRSHDWLLDLSRLFDGRTWAFTVPFMRTFYIVSDPACLEYVLKTRSSNFVKGAWFQSRMGQLLGKGIFNVDGHEWYWQRKMASHIFNVQKFKAYTSDTFAAKLQQLCCLLEGAAKSRAATTAAATTGCNGGSATGVVDLHQLMYQFTLDSFCYIGFGTDLGCVASAEPLPFAKAFDRAQMISQTRFWLPFWQVVELFNGSAYRLVHDVHIMRSFARGILESRQKQQQQVGSSGVVAPSQQGAGQEGKGGSDLLSMLLAADTVDGKPLSQEQLVDLVLNFIIAGRDTTAQALSWTFYLLMQHPEVEDKILKELHEVVGVDPRTPATSSDSNSGNAVPAAATHDKAATAPGGGAGSPAASTSSKSSTFEDLPDVPRSDQDHLAAAGKDQGTSKQQPVATKPAAMAAPPPSVDAGAAGASWAKPNYDQLRQLTFTKAVFMEALRLYPSVPQDGKCALEADVLPDGTRIPADSLVVYPPYAINRLSQYWGADSDQFRPERWLELSSVPSPYQFPTFNAGPRICLGQRLAELEGVYVLVGLLQRFRFRPAHGAPPVKYAFSTTLPMAHGLHVVVEPRC